MTQAQNRVLPQHPRTGVAHHLPDLLARGRLVAMHWALDADGFLRAKAAAFQADGRIIQKPQTLGAQRLARGVSGSGT